jgi:PAS domain S-box-containing protein
MSNTPVEYEKLLKEYQQLQLRVTQFSNVEQELINTRDRLDQELVLYKRLNRFNTDALKDIPYEKLLQLGVEAIVDILETESSIVYIQKKERESEEDVLHRFHCEGLGIDKSLLESTEAEIIALSEDLSPNKAHFLTTEKLQNYSFFDKFSRGLFFHFEDQELGIKGFFLGLISKEHDPIYKSIHSRQETIFTVFAQQFLSLISNRKKSKKIKAQFDQIERSEREMKKLSLIATKTVNGVIISDSYGRIEWINEGFTKITGYTLEEVRGKKPKDFLQGPNSQKETLITIREALQKKNSVDVTLINYTKKKEPYYNQLQITPVFDNEGNHIHFIALQRDITSEINSRQEILNINSRFELITKKAKMGIWELDVVNDKAIWNDIQYQIYGAERRNLGKDFFSYWSSFLHAEDKERVIKKANDFLQSQEEILEDEFKIMRGDDGEVRTLKTLLISERSAYGKLLRVVGTTTDITDIKQFENSLILKNEELKKINAELDNFVYSVSHDLRSPLLSVKGILSLVFKSGTLNEKNTSLLKMAETSVLKLDDTIQEILEYSRNSRLEVVSEKIQIKNLVQSIYDDLKYSTSDKINCLIEVNGVEEIISDASRIKILLSNIIGNSFKYHRNNIDNPFIKFELFREENHIVMKISDNGEGIAEKNIDHIFNMFYRASNKVAGTGLGLYICKEIINKINGSISVSSKINQGTTFTIYLPIKPVN